MHLRMRLAIGIAAVAMLAAACGNDATGATGGGVDGGAVTTRPGSTAATGAGAGSYYPTGSTGASGSTAAGASGATGAAADVNVSVNNYLFDPNPVKVSSGDVVAVRNDNTKTPHTFTVVGQDVDLELAPQETETVTVALPPGTYKLICRFHQSIGMTGTLVVT